MAAPTTYDDQRIYIKFLKKKCLDETKTCGCEGDCTCSTEKCSCCPAGLLEFIDDEGNNHGCVTPNDYDMLVRRTTVCSDGYALVVNNVSGQIIGCISEANFLAVYQGVNP